LTTWKYFCTSFPFGT